jgi:BCD family chlorophyll transporter-like MFS transporter
VIAAAPLGSAALFALSTLFIGLGGGLFGHGTLTATMNNAPADQAGLALGAWGAVQASAAGLGVALGGVIRDAAFALAPASVHGAATGYMIVYALEMALLAVCAVGMLPLFRRPPLGAAVSMR